MAQALDGTIKFTLPAGPQLPAQRPLLSSGIRARAQQAFGEPATRASQQVAPGHQ